MAPLNISTAFFYFVSLSNMSEVLGFKNEMPSVSLKAEFTGGTSKSET